MPDRPSRVLTGPILSMERPDTERLDVERLDADSLESDKNGMDLG